MGWINHMTTAGLIRNAQVLAEGGKLVIVRAAAGDGRVRCRPRRKDGAGQRAHCPELYPGRPAGGQPHQGPRGLGQRRLEEALSLTEAGLFVEDGEGGELLFCIATSYDTPLPVPAAGQGRFERRWS